MQVQTTLCACFWEPEMPLFDFERGSAEPMKRVFFQTFYNEWKQRLSHQDFSNIFNDIDDLFSKKAALPKPLVTMSWVPGADWTGTVFQPIYPACRYDTIRAAQLLGLIFMDVAIKRPENWGFGHYDLRNANGTLLPIKGRTYFLLRGSIN